MIHQLLLGSVALPAAAQGSTYLQMLGLAA